MGISKKIIIPLIIFFNIRIPAMGPSFVLVGPRRFYNRIII